MEFSFGFLSALFAASAVSQCGQKPELSNPNHWSARKGSHTPVPTLGTDLDQFERLTQTPSETAVSIPAYYFQGNNQFLIFTQMISCLW